MSLLFIFVRYVMILLPTLVLSDSICTDSLILFSSSFLSTRRDVQVILFTANTFSSNGFLLIPMINAVHLTIAPQFNHNNCIVFIHTITPWAVETRNWLRSLKKKLQKLFLYQVDVNRRFSRISKITVH